MDKLPIHPYFMYKDYFGVALFGLAFSFLVFFYPNLLGSIGLIWHVPVRDLYLWLNLVWPK